MRCRCGAAAITYLKHVGRYLCGECFTRYYLQSVSRAIKKYGILRKGERLLVAVSGGKDSSAMAFSLKKLEYDFELFHVDLGIPHYSEECRKVVEELAEFLDAKLSIVELSEYGFTIADIKGRTCSACGTAKRYLMNRFARLQGFDVVATGHTAEDIASTYLRNVAGGAQEWVEKLKPRNDPFDAKIVARAKPVFAMSERENMLLVLANDVPFTPAECPYAPQPEWKEIIYDIERRKPGFAKNFARGLVRKPREFGEVRYCSVCGEVANSDVCAFCKLVRRYGSTSCRS